MATERLPVKTAVALQTLVRGLSELRPAFSGSIKKLIKPKGNVRVAWKVKVVPHLAAKKEAAFSPREEGAFFGILHWVSGGSSSLRLLGPALRQRQ